MRKSLSVNTFFTAILILFSSCSNLVKQDVNDAGLKSDRIKQKEIEPAKNNYTSFGPYMTFSDGGLKEAVLSYYTGSNSADRTGIYLSKTNLILSESKQINFHHFFFNLSGPSVDYRIESGDSRLNDKSGGISIPAEAPFRFAVYGDSRSRYDLHEKVCNAIQYFKPDFVVHAGDMVENGNDLEQWHLFFDSALPLLTNTVLLPVRGNHDGTLGIFTNIFKNPGGSSYYSIDLPEARIIVLDTEFDYDVDSTQYSWLTNELAGISDKWKFMAFHRPPFSSSVHESDPETANVRKILEPVMRKYHVNLVLNGHDHLYERYEKNNVVYVTTGGGGAPFYTGTGNNEGRIKIITNQLNFLIIDVTKRKVSVKVYNEEKNELDGFDFIE